jgi:serine/threonine protein kinase
MPDQTESQFGKYYLKRLLGHGAFANVYLGEHIYLKQLRAVKILRVAVNKHEMANFLAEAQRHAQLDHPSIVRLLDFDVIDEIPLLVMEYAPNGTLRDRHPRGTRLGPDQVLGYIQPIASALHYIHKARLIHRDVKPANILLNAAGRPMLSDIGIATVAHSEQSLRTQDVSGTPAYMAPEQIQGRPTPSSDQYALAIMIYQWICGELPFFAGDISYQHVHMSPPPLRRPGLSVAPIIEQVILKALAKDQQQRFPSVEEFAREFTRACFLARQQQPSNPPIQTIPPQAPIQPSRIIVAEQNEILRTRQFFPEYLDIGQSVQNIAPPPTNPETGSQLHSFQGRSPEESGHLQPFTPASPVNEASIGPMTGNQLASPFSSDLLSQYEAPKPMKQPTASPEPNVTPLTPKITPNTPNQDKPTPIDLSPPSMTLPKLIESARKARERGEWEQAIAIFKQALDRNPQYDAGKLATELQTTRMNYAIKQINQFLVDEKQKRSKSTEGTTWRERAAEYAKSWEEIMDFCITTLDLRPQTGRILETENERRVRKYDVVYAFVKQLLAKSEKNEVTHPFLRALWLQGAPTYTDAHNLAQIAQIHKYYARNSRYAANLAKQQEASAPAKATIPAPPILPITPQPRSEKKAPVAPKASTPTPGTNEQSRRGPAPNTAASSASATPQIVREQAGVFYAGPTTAFTPSRQAPPSDTKSPTSRVAASKQDSFYTRFLKTLNPSLYEVLHPVLGRFSEIAKRFAGWDVDDMMIWLWRGLLLVAIPTTVDLLTRIDILAWLALFLSVVAMILAIHQFEWQSRSWFIATFMGGCLAIFAGLCTFGLIHVITFLPANNLSAHASAWLFVNKMFSVHMQELSGLLLGWIIAGVISLRVEYAVVRSWGSLEEHALILRLSPVCLILAWIILEFVGLYFNLGFGFGPAWQAGLFAVGVGMLGGMGLGGLVSFFSR